MDNADGDRGPRPAELLIVAQVGCTAIDVASILRKKRQAFSRYELSGGEMIVTGPEESMGTLGLRSRVASPG